MCCVVNLKGKMFVKNYFKNKYSAQETSSVFNIKTITILDWARYLMRTVWTNLYCDTVWTISILCCLYWRCHTLCTLLLGM